MRLEKIQSYLKEKQWKYEYSEEDGLGSIDFEHRGLSYHIWEFEDGGYGAETNVRTVGRQEDITGDYEKEIIDILKTWQGGERKMFEMARQMCYPTFYGGEKP